MKKLCDEANLVASMETIKRYAREMRDQERAAADAPLGEASGVDLSSNRSGRRGAKSKLTSTLLESYRMLIERYLHECAYLSMSIL